MILFFLIILCAFVIVMAFQTVVLMIVLGAVVAFLVIAFLYKKLSDWIDHKRFKRELDKRD